MTREEPSLETLWLKNIRKMDKVQNADPSNTAHRQTFIDEIAQCFVEAVIAQVISSVTER
jgi:hypothetical protein